MNQVRDWDGHCQQCGIETDEYTMSSYDVKLICMKCHGAEVSVSKCEEGEDEQTDNR